MYFFSKIRICREEEESREEYLKNNNQCIIFYFEYNWDISVEDIRLTERGGKIIRNVIDKSEEKRVAEGFFTRW